MARRIRRSRRIRPRRLRRGRRLRSRRRGVRPDGMHKEKVTIRRVMTNNSATDCYHNIHWLLT